jgi:cbb3-type cytochrome oxidase cytochrome c subunit
MLLVAVLPGCISYNGEKLFQKEGCIVCHSFNGIGGRMGPDLTAISNIRSNTWINTYIQDPQKINSLTRMPAFPHLSSSKRKAIIGYLNE